jgi:hypothetical protein
MTLDLWSSDEEFEEFLRWLDRERRQPANPPEVER